jgi:hypothetical protein
MEKERIGRMILLGLFLTILSGCGQTTIIRYVNNNEYMLPDGNIEVQLLETEMWAYAGLRETKAIKAGHFSVYKARFSVDLFKEIFPGRTTYYGWTINRETKKEFFTQLLISGFDEDNIPFAQVIIDGDESTGMIPEECSFLNLSTKFNRAYDVGGTMYPLDADVFSKEPEYRLEKVVEYGDEVDGLKVIANGKELVYDILANWSSFKRDSDGATFYTPLNETQMKQLAQLNPQYDFWNKYKYNAKLVVTPNYVAMGISSAFDVVISANAPSWGPDFDSMIKRDDMGLAMAYVLAFSKQNSQKVAELMYERMVTEQFNGKLPEEVVSKTTRTVTRKGINQSPETKITPREILSPHIWSDYKSKGIVSQEQAIDQLKVSLKMIAIPDEVISIFERVVLNRGYRYLSVRNGDKVLGVVIDGKVIHKSATVAWNEALRALPVKRYRLLNNKTNKMYSIGLTDYGHWVRFQ